jgi:hypothetical protein
MPGIPAALMRQDTPTFRWTPFDTAGGTIALGVALTLLIVLLLRVLQ